VFTLTLLLGKINKYYIFWAYVCSLSYPACKAYVPSVTCLALPYFSTLSHKHYNFWKKELLNIKCVFWFSLQLSSETSLFLRRIRQDIIINMHMPSCKVPVILVRFLIKCEFSQLLSKNSQISNLMKLHPVRAKLFYAGGKTEGGPTDKQTWRSSEKLFAILRTRLKTAVIKG